MSLLLISSLLSASAVIPSCSWDSPGHNPFMGDVVAAVDRYTDIPKDVRDALKKKMAKRQYDDVASINRNSITGAKGASYTNLREMHFGPGTICKTITRSKWKETAVERGLVYCEKEHCLIVPTVCRNVSRVTKKQEDPLEFETAAGPAKEEPKLPDPPPIEITAPLDFETAAGPSAIVPPIVPPVPTITPSFAPSIPSFPSITPNTLITFTTAVPEPSTWNLMLIGVLFMLWMNNLRNTKK